MTTERDRMAYMLAETILGLRDSDAKAPHPDPRMSKAGVEVQIRLEGMTRGLIEHIWMNSAAVAESAEAAVREATKDISLEKLVRDTVAAEVARIRSEITGRIRASLEKAIEAELAAALYEPELGLPAQIRAVAREAVSAAAKEMRKP